MLSEEYARTHAFEEDYWWFVGRRALVERALAPVLGDGKARLLDVGCGTGYGLQRLGSRAVGYGIDLMPEALAFCRGRGLERIALARAERLPFADAAFDAVTALDVLEHLDDDRVALAEWARVLRPGGRLILFVPAFEFLWSGEDFVSGHRRRYRRGALGARVREAGLEVRKLTYANALLLPGVVGTIFFNRLQRPRRLYESNLKPLPAQLNRLLTSVFRFEAGLLSRADAPIGSSVLCVADKPEVG